MRPRYSSSDGSSWKYPGTSIAYSQGRVGQSRVSAKIWKLKKANSFLFFLSTIWWFDALKRIEKIIRKNAFEQNKKKPGLKFNPGLALVGLGTTGPWWTNTFIQFKSVNSNFRVLISSRNPEYSLFWDRSQNGFSFRDTFEDEFIAINEAALPSNTKKARKFGLLVWTGYGNFFLIEFITKSKKWTSQNPQNYCNSCRLKRNRIKALNTKWLLLFSEITFSFLFRGSHLVK